MYITDYCKPEYIYLNIEPLAKYACLSNLIKYLKEDYSAEQLTSIKNTLIKREEMSSTGLGNQIAAPHCRCITVKKPCIKIFRSKKPIEFEALDKKPVSIFFLMLLPSHSKNEYLTLLSNIAKIGKHSKWVKTLLNCTSSEEFYNDLEKFEHSF